MTTNEQDMNNAADAKTNIPPFISAGQVLWLTPEQIKLPEISNVRPFSSKGEDSEREIKAIENLMTSIEEEGQLQPVVVMPTKDEFITIPGTTMIPLPVYELIAGRRRLRAITMHNMASEEDKQLKVKAIIGDPVKSISQLFRRAAHENMMREDISAIDKAYNIRITRKNKKWTQAKDTPQVAAWFGVSEAQITQLEKLLTLDEVYHKHIADGVLKADGAFALLKVKADKRDEVFKLAQEKQKAELTGLDVYRAAMPETQAPGPALEGTKKKGAKSGAAKEGGVKSKHIKSAARQVEPGTKQSRTKKEILEFFAGCLGPAYGYENGAVHQFVINFAKFAKGEIQERTLEKYFDAMVEKAPRGTPPPKETKEKESTAKPKK